MQHQVVVAVADDALSLATEMQQGCLGVRAGRLHRLISRRFEQALRPLGLSLPQMEVLSALTLWGEPAKPADLADVLSIERSTMSRNLSLMQARGLVEATDTSPTGRSMAVTVTAEGTRALSRAHQSWKDTQASLVAQVGADTPAVLSGWIDQLTA